MEGMGAKPMEGLVGRLMYLDRGAYQIEESSPSGSSKYIGVDFPLSWCLFRAVEALERLHELLG